MKRRVGRLVARGAIRGFTALVDPAVLGRTTEAYVVDHTQTTIVLSRLVDRPRT